MIRHLQLSEIDWPGLNEKLAIGDSEEDEQARDKMWP